MDNIKIQKEPIDFKKTFAGLGAVILLMIAVFVWFFIQGIPNIIGNTPVYEAYKNGVVPVKDTPSPQGELYLTLTPKSGGPTDGYIYDFKTKNIRPISDATNSADYLSLFYSFDDSGTKNTYIGVSNYSSVISNKNNQLALFFKNGTFSKEEKILSLSQAPMGPAVISPNAKQILFTQRSKKVKNGSVPNTDDLSIILVKQQKDGKWNSKRLWSGAYPQWVTNGLFYYLKNDGIYLGMLDSNFEDKVWKTNGILASNSRLSISNNKKYLAWTLPGAGKVIIFSSKYDKKIKTFVLKELYTIKTSAFWVVFSPDGTKFAVQAVNWNTLETDPNPRIEIYSTKTGKKAYDDISLNYFIQTAMFLTDWR